MVPHVNAVCQSSFFHLRNIGFIRKYLTYDAAKIIIHAFVVSKLDYCNSLLYGLPSYLIRKLQHVQNSAARLLNLSLSRAHNIFMPTNINSIVILESLEVTT